MATETTVRELVVRTERGLGLAGTRVTLYDLMDYLAAGWPPRLIRDRLGITEEQVEAALEYIRAHEPEVRSEYEEVLREAEETRAYWEARNQAPIAPPSDPEQEALRAKLQAWKVRTDEATAMPLTAIDPSTAAVREVVRRLVEHYQPDKVILFGSHAWGEPDAGSDVDLFIVKETEARSLDRKRAVRRLLYATGDVPFPLDLLVYTPEEIGRRVSLGDPFVRQVLNEGVVLYDAT